MGREVRRVPADWQHPKEWNEYRQRFEYRPMHDSSSFEDADSEWMEGWRNWQRGLQDDGKTPIDAEDRGRCYTWYAGPRPSPDDYMPDWPAEQRTHFMMYEDMSEGTPISPAFETPEELARWLADNGASSFGNSTATYEQWLSVARGGWAPSMVIQNGHVMSGVEFASAIEAQSGETEGLDPKDESAAPHGGETP